VPAYARVSAGVIDAIRDSLSEEDDEARAQLDDAFERFENLQPTLSAHVGDVLSEPLDETALALGYFLTLTIFLAFERAHGEHVAEVDLEGIQATEELISLDEQLRKSDPAEAVDTDDVIAMEQPHLCEYVHEHVDGTLEAHADDVDVDDIHTVYRLVLVEILALSYAVQVPQGFPVAKNEILA
jgi:hypothetical protein